MAVDVSQLMQLQVPFGACVPGDLEEWTRSPHAVTEDLDEALELRCAAI